MRSVVEFDDREEYLWDNLTVDIDPNDEIHQAKAQLCPPILGCFYVATGKAHMVSVDNLEPITWNKEAIDHLVIAEDKKQLLKGLVAHHSHRSN